MAGEFEIIARHFAPLAGPGGLGLLDDAALIAPPPGREMVITTDAIVAGVHFFPDDPPATIGHKALGVNLSDLAAKGADPLGFVMSFAMPRRTDDAWISAFAEGLGLLAAANSCPLLGGDTVATPGPLTLSITAFGTVPAGTMVKRGSARPGDRLLVTGSIGNAALGLQSRLASMAGSPWPLAADHIAFLDDRYLRPRPRCVIAGPLRDHAHAAMDISDGFIGDLTKMIGLAGLGATVQLADVPHSVAARAAIRHDAALAVAALTGGDDYEVLAAVPPDHSQAFMAKCLAAGLRVTEVGSVAESSSEILFLDAEGKPKTFAQGSYVHGGNATS